MTDAPHLTVTALQARARAAEDPVARRQWQMLWLLAQGAPMAEVSQVRGQGVRRVQEIARRYPHPGGRSSPAHSAHRLPLVAA
jgi:hypothetical protein